MLRKTGGNCCRFADLDCLSAVSLDHEIEALKVVRNMSLGASVAYQVDLVGKPVIQRMGSAPKILQHPKPKSHFVVRTARFQG
jgi:hypothetical protein